MRKGTVVFELILGTAGEWLGGSRCDLKQKVSQVFLQQKNNSNKIIIIIIKDLGGKKGLQSD